MVIAPPMSESDIALGLKWMPTSVDYSDRCAQLCTAFAASTYSVVEISKHLNVHQNICLAFIEFYGSDWARYMVVKHKCNPWDQYRLFRVHEHSFTAHTYALLYGVKVANVLADLKSGKPVPRQRAFLYDVTRDMARKSGIGHATLQKHGMISRTRLLPPPTKKGA